MLRPGVMKVLLLVSLLVRALCLDLSHTGLTHIPTNLPQDTAQLTLSNNYITNIADHAFHGMYALNELQINKNQIYNIGLSAFQGTVIENLIMWSNKLRKVPYLGDIRRSLRLLSLSNNLITVLLEDDFRGLDSIQTLYVSANPLVYVADLYLLLPSLGTLRVTNTPFKCCLSLAALKEVPADVIEIDIAPCSFPFHMVGIPWADINKPDMENQTCGEAPFVFTFMMAVISGFASNSLLNSLFLCGHFIVY